jgi:1-acyl-sn-glycerol-3-phosphate acyltransferase
VGRIADEFLARHPDLLEGDDWSPAFARLVAALTAPLERYFRFRLSGLERLPDGPCLVVANHSAGAIFEILLLHRTWRRRLPDRPARGLAHKIGWLFPFSLVPVVSKLGGIFAHPAVARRALERGHVVLVFPGGELDAFRSFFDRDRVVFGGRSGFVRVAREAGVPIVPLAFCGSHALYFMLPGATAVARWIRLERLVGGKAFAWTGGFVLAAAALGVTVVVPVLWPLFAAAVVQFWWPLPSRIEAELLEPIVPGESETDEAAAERVRATIEAAIGRMSQGRICPWM